MHPLPRFIGETGGKAKPKITREERKREVLGSGGDVERRNVAL
jgi:hypothetical protein